MLPVDSSLVTSNTQVLSWAEFILRGFWSEKVESRKGFHEWAEGKKVVIFLRVSSSEIQNRE